MKGNSSVAQHTRQIEALCGRHALREPELEKIVALSGAQGRVCLTAQPADLFQPLGGTG